MVSSKTIAAIGLAVLIGAMGATAARAADDLLKTVKDRGKVRVCDAEYAPWNVKNPLNNQWEGIDIDIVDLIAKELKVEVEHVDATFGTAVPSMLTQKCDFIAAPFYISAGRAELISFTRPFAQDGITTFVTQSSTATTLEELDKPGKIVAVRSGSYEEPIAKRLFKQATVKTLTSDSGAIQLLEIAAGRADAALGAYFGNLHFLKQNPNMKVRLLSDNLLTKTSIAFAVPPREYFFRDYLSTALLTFEENGRLKEILDKWFR
jgi:ABC-type amino acid transport substrate-binding protein